MPYLRNKSMLSFNDILLIPSYSDIKSRLDTNLETYLTKNIKLKHPICSTNMSMVTELKMMETMSKMGGAGFLHRFMDNESILSIIQQACVKEIYPIVISVGVKESDYQLINEIKNSFYKPHAILVDIAHGFSLQVVDMVKYIKANISDIDVIAGNVATGQGAAMLVNAGADAIRAGIGGGSCCTTRLVTGHGMPTLQSIIDITEYFIEHKINVPIIADGGIKDSGDIVKALAFGANTVSLGRLLAATSDSPGEPIEFIQKGATQKMKKIYGMASKEAQETHRDGLKNGTAAEGISLMLEYKGETEDVIQELLGGVRSGLTYSGSRNIFELRDNAEYGILNYGGMIESKMT